MKTVPYPTNADTMGFSWQDRFSFPIEFVQELHEKFPGWTALEEVLKREDEPGVWNFLYKYQERLANISLQDVIEAHATNDVASLIDRAGRQASELKIYIYDLEKRYFPEKVAERDRRQKQDDEHFREYYGSN